MSEEIKFKKSNIIGILGIVIIVVFVLVAVRNAISKDNNIGTDLVKGGDSGGNKVVIDGDTQIINLGVANYNYDPSEISVKSGKSVKIIGNMQQLQGCLRAFTIPKMGISKVFSNKDNILEFTPTQKGRFGFSCSMGMGTGTLIVE
ncbi:cupredoxin domain-containing protein [Candidatus Woesearchaeota archaeon]|nr:cupredoxin domain-containing protein [Candidatus Woesearchaeota archaeon]